jgi:hypothetical protein
MNIDNLQKYFEPIIEVQENPFYLISQKTYKEDGKVQSQIFEEKIILKTIMTDDLISDIIGNKKIEMIDFYPTNFFTKLFNNKKKNLLKVFNNMSPDEFMFMSELTFQKILDFGIYIDPVFDDIDDNIILITSRQRLIFRQNDKLELSYNLDFFKVFKLS